jgi:hypothetical protein
VTQLQKVIEFQKATFQQRVLQNVLLDFAVRPFDGELIPQT